MTISLGGLIRAHGGGGGGGDTTTSSPWGTTVETTYDTTFDDTTLPYDTTIPPTTEPVVTWVERMQVTFDDRLGRAPEPADPDGPDARSGRIYKGTLYLIMCNSNDEWSSVSYEIESGGYRITPTGLAAPPDPSDPNCIYDTTWPTGEYR